MAKILFTVPEDTITKAQILSTETRFGLIFENHFGTEIRPTMLWTLSPAGQTFQAGRPADIYLAMIEVANGLDQALREAAMWDFARAWAETLAIDLERLMVTAADSDTVTKYLQGNRARLRTLSQPWFLLSTLLTIFRSRQRDGFAALRANL